MSPTIFLLILSGVLLNSFAQLLLKAGARSIETLAFTWENFLPIAIKLAGQAPLLGGLACYAVSVVVWILALSRVDVSIAYPMLSMGYVVNAIAAWALFGETLNAQRILGIAIILIGVVVLTRN